MFRCIILYYVMLYYIVLCYVILYCIMICCIIPYYIVSCYVMKWYMLRFVIPYCILQCNIISYSIMLCYVILYCIMLFYDIYIYIYTRISIPSTTNPYHQTSWYPSRLAVNIVLHHFWIRETTVVPRALIPWRACTRPRLLRAWPWWTLGSISWGGLPPLIYPAW